MTEKIIYYTERDEGGRYRVESIRDAGGWRWDSAGHTDGLAVAQTLADSLVRNSGHAEARVIDTQAEEES